MTENETVVFRGPRDVAVEERSRPEPGADEVLVETSRSLVSTGTELANLVEGDDTYVTDDEWDPDFPTTTGYCNVGTVIDAGPEVDDAIVGRRVTSYSHHAKYVTAKAPAPGTSQFGTYRPVPDGVTDDEAAFATIAEIVMNGVRRGRVSWGEAAAVFGLGLLGQLAVRFCRYAGADPVIGLDLEAPRRDLLPDGPRVEALDAGAEGYVDELRDRCGGDLADVVFEVTGSPKALANEPRVLRDQGRFVLLGSPRGETTFDFNEYCHGSGQEIIGAHNKTHPPVETPATPWTQERHAELFFSLLAKDAIGVEELITHRFDADDAPDAYEMLLEDRTEALGVVFEWD